MLNVETLSYAFLIGFVPILIWLAFWLLQDTRHPEPRKLIVRAFVVGIVAVLLVLPVQQFTATLLPTGFVLIVVWAFAEEAIKLLVAWFAVLRHKAVNEPIDLPIYLITVALGFAAFENTLFVLTPLQNGELVTSIVTGNLRFIGASLIHVLSSAVIGGALAFAFFKQWPTKILYGLIGVILASLLHALFNFSILSFSADLLVTIFAGVWVGIVFLLLILEKIKLLKRPAWWEQMFVSKK